MSIQMRGLSVYRSQGRERGRGKRQIGETPPAKSFRNEGKACARSPEPDTHAGITSPRPPSPWVADLRHTTNSSVNRGRLLKARDI